MLYHGIWDDMWELPEKDSFAKSVSRQNGMYQMLSWDNQCHPNSCNSYLREKSMERISEKSSICAYFFSIILPGLGQIYLDHKKRGFTILTGALILSLALSFLFAFPLNWILWLCIGYGKCSTHFSCTNLSTRELKHLVINKVLNSTTFKLH
jgi:TM2 domain-containing membrane protein YozV